MVIVRRRGSGTRVLGGGAARDANTNSKWRHHGRLLEDEVAAEELLGGGEGSIGYGALDKDRAGCQSSSQCAGKGGVGSYTRPCTYKDHCPQ
ncbi:hypothetical protein HU200_052731 [Digitaria exilis]|uniref:Uncharacterized protein n=1 Tax=Digitaria exilis TaxID=1010633 RepID=A0A835ASP2_9POAL|nr:hypothetical protein HU200_052731 [Digitaria exilis]